MWRLGNPPPSAGDVALTVTGAALGAGAALGGAVWLVLRACERHSDRGFGSD